MTSKQPAPEPQPEPTAEPTTAPASDIDKDAPPPPPEDDAPPAPPSPEEVLAARRAKLAKSAGAFKDRVADGMARAKKMEAAVAELGSSPSQLEVMEKAARLAKFERIYKTARITHSDTELTDTTWALNTVWVGATDSESYYKATPDLDRGLILSWQLQREGKDELRSSDIFFFQYRMMRSGTGPLPRLKLIRQQKSYSASLMPVLDYLRDCDLTGRDKVPRQRHEAGSDEYYALLGTQNGSGPAYLVIDWARDLGIGGISAIGIDETCNTYFHFSPLPVPESSSKSSSSSSSSSSTSSSSMSKSSTSESSSESST